VTANLLGIDSKEPIQAAVKTAPMKLGMTSTSSLSFAQNWKTILLTSRVEASSANFDFGGRRSVVYIYAITIPQGLLAQNESIIPPPGICRYRRSTTSGLPFQPFISKTVLYLLSRTPKRFHPHDNTPQCTFPWGKKCKYQNLRI
jgi:hypothetical protein